MDRPNENEDTGDYTEQLRHELTRRFPSIAQTEFLSDEASGRVGDTQIIVDRVGDVWRVQEHGEWNVVCIGRGDTIVAAFDDYERLMRNGEHGMTESEIAESEDMAMDAKRDYVSTLTDEEYEALSPEEQGELADVW
jgi:hypothetical protein